MGPPVNPFDEHDLTAFLALFAPVAIQSASTAG
jgi:hypothetical protein